MAPPLGSVALAEVEPGNHQVEVEADMTSRAQLPCTEAWRWAAAGGGGMVVGEEHSRTMGADGAVVADQVCGGSKAVAAGQWEAEVAADEWAADDS